MGENKVQKDHRSSLKPLKIRRYWAFSLLQPLDMVSLSNSRWQNSKERPNQYTNNRDVVEKAKRL